MADDKLLYLSNKDKIFISIPPKLLKIHQKDVLILETSSESSMSFNAF